MTRRRHTGRAHAVVVTALALLALALGGCEDSVQFRIRLEWQRLGDGAAQACPTMTDGSYSCAAIPMSCDVRVRVRIVGAANDQTHYSECFHIENDGDACLLADLPISPKAIPNEMVRVQVIVWTVDELVRSGVDLGATDGCPVTTPFAGGLPKLGVSPTETVAPREPVPALGGEQYFAVGKSPVATITLGCPAYDALDAPVCRDNSVTLEATVLNPSTVVSISPDQTSGLEVRFGPPTPNGDGSYRVDGDDLSPALARPMSGELIWQGVLATPPVGMNCLRVSALGVAGPSIACADVGTPDAEHKLYPVGFLVGRTLLRALLTMQALVDLPEPGMVLGVVVDARRRPVPGATVTGSDGATVFYPDDNILAVGSSTNSKGFFVSRNAPFGTRWSAVGPGGLVDNGAAVGGLIDDHVSVVVVQLDGTVPELDAGIGPPPTDAGVDLDAGVDAP